MRVVLREKAKWFNKMRAADRCPEKAGVGGSISVPGHHLFKYLQAIPNPVSFRFIPKLWSVGTRLRNETGFGPHSRVLGSASVPWLVLIVTHSR